ncbi:PucR family transcriptional regulator [Streptomyces sp. enrichment culture]|uniref:PucR family transcriptional regulator n=1 Tax=Streptomyces sp. enrichment culture TaxID=1795815 RepID=UPI003F575D57
MTDWLAPGRTSEQGGATPAEGETGDPANGRHRRGPSRSRWLPLLAAALAGEPAPDEPALRELAHRAGWPLPPRLRAVAVAPPPPSGLPGAGPGWLADWGAAAPYVLIAQPGPEPADVVRRLLPESDVAIGPALPRERAGASLRWARTLLSLAAGPGRRPGAVYVEEHLPAVLLAQDEALVLQLVRRRLGPLAVLPPAQAERLAETLLVWFECGSAAQTARVLRVHPQTVRYRIRQAERLFGDELRAPGQRLEFVLALNGLRLTARSRRHLAAAALRRSRGRHSAAHGGGDSA